MKFIDKFRNKGPKRDRIDIAARFQLGGRVGQGSMSKVWRALDTLSGREVALKVLDGVRMRRFESRFAGLDKPSEGEVAVILDHPNIVTTYEYGWTNNEEQFLIMEFVDGVSLSLLVDLQNETLQRNRLKYMIQIGDAVKYTHSKGFIHRDICPRNLLVTRDNDIKLIDFGLVVPNTPEFQRPGNRTGTAAYMAPELIKRQRTDERIDIFSYAVTCFELYTKRHPWEAGLTIETVLQHINEPPKEIRELVPRIDQGIADIIMKGLERHPDDRWQSTSEMVRHFRDAERRLIKSAKAAMARKKAKKNAAKPKPSDT